MRNQLPCGCDWTHQLAVRSIWLVGGTRPEALKLGPVVAALRRQGLMCPTIVATGQHPTMFHQGLAAFDERPGREIHLRRDSGTQGELVARLVRELDREIQVDAPDAVVVQGDTSSALAGALTAFWRQIPVVHLEAGLRSGDLGSPFPEEGNRKMIGQIAALHLAPTPAAAANLMAENIPGDHIRIIGNTVVDAVLQVAERTTAFRQPALDDVERLLGEGRRLVLVTVHRRESWGEPLRRVLAAVTDLLSLHPDVTVAIPVHPNPIIRDEVLAALGGHENVVITDPLDYPDLVRLLGLSTLVLSDSGGIQEEAPSLDVPVLVLREVTERVEAVEAGCALLVGTDRNLIVKAASHLLSNEQDRVGMTRLGNPFGDGRSADRAAEAIASLLGSDMTVTPEFRPHLSPAAAWAG